MNDNIVGTNTVLGPTDERMDHAAMTQNNRSGVTFGFYDRADGATYPVYSHPDAEAELSATTSVTMNYQRRAAVQMLIDTALACAPQLALLDAEDDDAAEWTMTRRYGAPLGGDAATHEERQARSRPGGSASWPRCSPPRPDSSRPG